MTVLLRRRRLGLTSCRGVASFMEEPVQVVRNDHEMPETDLVFRWGCTSTVQCKNVINTAHAIHQVNDKASFRELLDEHELCPATWANRISHEVTFPCIVRPARHAQGRRLWVAESSEQLLEIVHNNVPEPEEYYISELINKVAEYRVFVIQGRVAWVAQKTPGNPEDVAWNVARGGRFDNVRWDDWPLKAVRVSIEAFNLSDLDFGGVDVMVDAEGNAYVIEINSAPSLTSEYRQRSTAKCFDYIIRNGKVRIPLIQDRGGYRKFIHPAVCNRALIG